MAAGRNYIEQSHLFFIIRLAFLVVYGFVSSVALFAIACAALFRVFGFIDGLVDCLALFIICGVTFLFVNRLVDGFIGGFVTCVALFVAIMVIAIITSHLKNEQHAQDAKERQPTLATHCQT